MVKHTPGPWRRHNVTEISARDGMRVASLANRKQDFRSTEEIVANGNIMAASLDGYGAAKEALGSGRQCSATEIAISKGAWLALRDFVAAAEGDPDAG
jgi:hypothetical protein